MTAMGSNEEWNQGVDSVGSTARTGPCFGIAANSHFVPLADQATACDLAMKSVYAAYDLGEMPVDINVNFAARLHKMVQGIITVLAVINPVVYGAIFFDVDAEALADSKADGPLLRRKPRRPCLGLLAD